MLVVFDNAVTGAAVLLARALCPTVDDYVCPSAQYQEPVHQMQMKKLDSNLSSNSNRTSTRGWVRAMGLTMLDAAVQMMNDNLK